MLTLKFIQDNKADVIKRLKTKRFDAASIIDTIISLDDNRKQTQAQAETLEAEMNIV